MLAHIQGTFATPREDLLESLLIKLDDQRLGSGPKGLIIALSVIFFLLKEIVPSGVDILFFTDFEEGKNLQKLKRITSN